MARDNHLTVNDALDFLSDRAKIHLMGANKIAREEDIIEDEIALMKYNSRIDLANKYQDVHDILLAYKNK